MAEPKKERHGTDEALNDLSALNIVSGVLVSAITEQGKHQRADRASN